MEHPYCVVFAAPSAVMPFPSPPGPFLLAGNKLILLILLDVCIGHIYMYLY